MIYAACDLACSAFLKYSGSLDSKSATKASNCVSLNVKISCKLASIASIMMDMDLAKVMSAISSTRKKNSSPKVL